MDYRSLGRTGVQVSPVCLGAMMFGGPTPPEEGAAIIDRAIGAGVNFIDTANGYNAGRSEQVVGEALQPAGKRGRIVLATKVFMDMDPADPNMHGVSRRHVMQQCEASLRRLRTDWIDLYQVHRPVPAVAIDETLRALDDLVRQGKVRYIGTSTFAAWQVVEALWAAKELRLNRFVTEQPPYNLLDRRIERELLPMAETFGLGVIPWSPLAGGFLAGKYKRGQAEQAEGRHTRRRFYGRHFTDACFDVAERVEQVAAEKGCTASQLALAWCMGQRGVTSPIIGPRTMAQLEDNLGALDVTLTDGDRKRLDEVAPPGRAVLPNYYNANFGPHAHRW
jgi:aryl-alcohol dehydrogenase-like predicted oxidoreductase